jgi:thioesterase domain-containing protein
MSRQAIVFVHTWGLVEPAYLAELARATDGEFPLYALAPPTDPEVLVGLNTVEDWVAWELDRLAETPIEPPYRLMGWSFGGVVALELARRLVSDGVEVEWVGMVDAWRPQHTSRSRLARLGRQLDALDRRSAAERRAYLADLAGTVPRRVRCSVTRQGQRLARRAGLLAKDECRPVDPAFRSIWVPHLKYRPEPAPAGLAVTLYPCATSVEMNGSDPSLGWSPWLQHGFEVVRLPGDHRSLWQPPQIGVLAASLGPAGDARSGPRGNRGRAELHRHVLDPPDEVGPQVLGLAVALEIGQPGEDLGEDRAKLHAGQVGAEAEVRTAPAEGDVLVG